MTEAVIMTIDGVRTRVTTNEAVISLAVPLEHSALISALMPKVGHQVGVAMSLVGDNPKKYGQQASALRKSGFCMNPKLWDILGGDKVYLAWLKDQNCVFNKKAAEVGACEGDNVPAHIRRVSRGAGTAIKPEYSACTMCNKHHQLQHSSGEGALIDPHELEVITDSQLHDWAWYALKTHLGYSSMAEVPPNELVRFAVDHDLDKSLPRVYR